MLAMLAFLYLNMDTGAITASIILTETYNNTSVELACTYTSDNEDAVGYYRKLPSEKSFGRTIAIGGNGSNCQMSYLPENIGCRCVSNRHVSCTVYNLTTANEGEEWKCQIPDTNVGIYSNVVRISRHRANSITIRLMETFDYTSVELSCTYQSDTDVMVGYYRKLPSETFGIRTLSIGGNCSKRQKTTFPENIGCWCVSNRHVTCTVYNLTSANEGEEWSCAIPNDGLIIFSNVARLSLLLTKTTGIIESTKRLNGSALITTWSTNGDTNIENVRKTQPFIEERTKIAVIIASLIGGLILVAAVTVLLCFRYRKSREQLSEHMPTEEESGPHGTMYHSIPDRCVHTADGRSVDSRYYIGCIAENASQSSSHAITLEENVEDVTKQTEANGDTEHYSEIPEDMVSRPNAGSLDEYPLPKYVQMVTDVDPAHYTDSMECSSQTFHCIRFNTPTFATNQCLFAECVLNKETGNKGACIDTMPRKITDDNITYAECVPNMIPPDNAAYLSPIEATETRSKTKKLDDNIYLTAIYGPVPKRRKND